MNTSFKINLVNLSADLNRGTRAEDSIVNSVELQRSAESQTEQHFITLFFELVDSGELEPELLSLVINEYLSYDKRNMSSIEGIETFFKIIALYSEFDYIDLLDILNLK